MRFSLYELSFALILTGARFLATTRGMVGGVWFGNTRRHRGAYHSSGKGGHKL